MKKILFVCFLILYAVASPRTSSEALCNKYVEIEETAWYKLKTNVNKYNWGEKSFPSIRDWDSKQVKARKMCQEKDGHLYEGITILNKRVEEFGNAGGFKVKY